MARRVDKKPGGTWSAHIASLKDTKPRQLGLDLELPRAEVRSPADLLEPLYAFSAAGQNDQALDRLFEEIPRQLSAGRFDLCNAILGAVQITRLSPSILMGFLIATVSARATLPARKALHERIRVFLVDEMKRKDLVPVLLSLG